MFPYPAFLFGDNHTTHDTFKGYVLRKNYPHKASNTTHNTQHTIQDCEMVNLHDESHETLLLKRKVARLKVQRVCHHTTPHANHLSIFTLQHSIDDELVELEEDLVKLEDGKRVREASNMNNALALLRRHFGEFRERQESASLEIERLRDLVERTSDVCLEERKTSDAWREKYRHAHEQLTLLRKQHAAASVVGAPVSIPALGIDAIDDATIGARVAALFPNSTAASSGIEVGDVIVEANAATVYTPEDLLRTSVTQVDEV